MNKEAKKQENKISAIETIWEQIKNMVLHFAKNLDGSRKEKSEKNEQGKKKFILLFLVGIALLIAARYIENRDNSKDLQNQAKRNGIQTTSSQAQKNITLSGETINSLYATPFRTASSSRQSMPGGKETVQNQALGEYDSSQNDSMEAYGKSVEKRLSELIADMDGAGRTRVMLIMDCSSQLILAKDSPYEKREQQDTKKEESSMVSETKSSSEIAYYEDENGNKIPIVQKKNAPRVKGIVVLCEGGDKPSVVRLITEILVALFDMDEHRIKVAKLK